MSKRSDIGNRDYKVNDIPNRKKCEGGRKNMMSASENTIQKIPKKEYFPQNEYILIKIKFVLSDC